MNITLSSCCLPDHKMEARKYGFLILIPSDFQDVKKIKNNNTILCIQTTKRLCDQIKFLLSRKQCRIDWLVKLFPEKNQKIFI